MEGKGEYTIVVGNADKESNAKKFKVDEVVMHGSFNTTTSDNDFALLKLQESLVEGDNIKVVTLPKSGFEVTSNMTGLVTGWGGSDPSVDSVANLQSVEVTVISTQECEAKYKRMKVPITKNMLCAGDLIQGGKDCKFM